MDLMCFISDTHGSHNQLNVGAGDFLIHSGDAELNTRKATRKFAEWMAAQNYRYKIFVPGNHDSFFEAHTKSALREMERLGIIVLMNKGIQIESIKFWGAPYTSPWGDWFIAFTGPGPELKFHAGLIPPKTDVLISHGPPIFILDNVGHASVGCQFLANKVLEVAPKIHAFGHIHESWGMKTAQNTLFINAAQAPSNLFTRFQSPVMVEFDQKDMKVNDFYPKDGP